MFHWYTATTKEPFCSYCIEISGSHSFVILRHCLCSKGHIDIIQGEVLMYLQNLCRDKTIHYTGLRMLKGYYDGKKLSGV